MLELSVSAVDIVEAQSATIVCTRVVSQFRRRRAGVSVNRVASTQVNFPRMATEVLVNVALVPGVFAWWNMWLSMAAVGSRGLFSSAVLSVTAGRTEGRTDGQLEVCVHQPPPCVRCFTSCVSKECRLPGSDLSQEGD